MFHRVLSLPYTPPCIRRSPTRRSGERRHMSRPLYSVCYSKRNMKIPGTRERAWTGNIWQLYHQANQLSEWHNTAASWDPVTFLLINTEKTLMALLR